MKIISTKIIVETLHAGNIRRFMVLHGPTVRVTEIESFLITDMVAVAGEGPTMVAALEDAWKKIDPSLVSSEVSVERSITPEDRRQIRDEWHKSWVIK